MFITYLVSVNFRKTVSFKKNSKQYININLSCVVYRLINSN